MTGFDPSLTPHRQPSGLTGNRSMDLSRFDAIIAAVLTLQDDRTPGDQEAATATRRFTPTTVPGFQAPPAQGSPSTTRTRGRRAQREANGRTNRWLSTVFQIRRV
ncbi:hypothetical protein ABH924_004809 [Arthrobacter sp. GAS37]